MFRVYFEYDETMGGYDPWSPTCNNALRAFLQEILRRLGPSGGVVFNLGLGGLSFDWTTSEAWGQFVSAEKALADWTSFEEEFNLFLEEMGRLLQPAHKLYWAWEDAYETYLDSCPASSAFAEEEAHRLYGRYAKYVSRIAWPRYEQAFRKWLGAYSA